jgi:hypothetical protein
MTLGLRNRNDYFGRFEQNQVMLTASTGWATDEDVRDIDEFIRIRNPVWLRSAGLSQTFDLFNIEGRYGAVLNLERTRKPHLTFGPEYRTGITLRWMVPDDARYLDRGYYEDVGTAELELSGGVSDTRGPWRLGLGAAGGGGVVYNSGGIQAATGRNDLDPYYYRASVEGTAERALTTNLGLKLRGYAAMSRDGNGETAKQRQVYTSGADPLQQFNNPFLRSRGALLVRPDFNWQMPGGGNLRGFDPHLSTAGLVAANLELERTVLTRHEGKFFRRVSIAAFGDAGHAIDDAAGLKFLGDAGAGIRAAHRIGQMSFVTRVDFPFYVNRADLAQDRHPGSDEFGFRWQVGIQVGQ